MSNIVPQPKKSPKYIASDGSSHDTRDLAAKQNLYLARLANLQAIDAGQVQGGEYLNEYVKGDGQTGLYVTQENIPQFLATNAELLLAALTVKSGRGRKPKSVAA